MKKIFTLLSFLMLGAMAFAQQYYVFADKDGNVIEDGATITRTEVEDDGFSVLLKSGLYLKNVDAPSNYTATVKANITRIDNGAVQLCFPTNCYSYDKVGTYGGNDKKALSKGESHNLQTEWIPTEYGECIVEYTATSYQNLFSKGTYKITVHYVFADPSGVTNARKADVQPLQGFDLQGRQAMVGQHGLTIVRMSDGSIRKVFNSK
jgi:hypothetical protein